MVSKSKIGFSKSWAKNKLIEGKCYYEPDVTFTSEVIEKKVIFVQNEVWVAKERSRDLIYLLAKMFAIYPAMQP